MAGLQSSWPSSSRPSSREEFGVVRVHLRVEIRISSRQRPRAPEATERRIAPGRRSAPCPSQEGVLWSLPPDSHTLLHLSTPHLVSHTDAPDTRSPLRVPTRAGGPIQKQAPLQRTARPSDARPATVRPRRRLSRTLACHHQVTSAQSKPAPAAVAATPAWQLEEGRNIEMTGCTSKEAAQHHRPCISSARRGNS